MYWKPVGSGSYTLFLDTGAAATAFDTGATGPAAPDEFSPHFVPLTQRGNLAAPGTTPATPAFRAPRGNVVCTISFKSNVPYGSLAAALASIRAFAVLLNTQFQLKVVQDAEVQYYPNAMLPDYQPIVSGGSVYHKATFETDLVTSVAPP